MTDVDVGKCGLHPLGPHNVLSSSLGMQTNHDNWTGTDVKKKEATISNRLGFNTQAWDDAAPIIWRVKEHRGIPTADRGQVSGPDRWSNLLKEQQSELRQKRCSLTCLTSVETFGSSPQEPTLWCRNEHSDFPNLYHANTGNLRTTPLSVFIKTADIPLIGVDTGSHYCRWVGCRPLWGKLECCFEFPADEYRETMLSPHH